MHVFPSSTPLLFHPFHVKCFPPLGRLLKVVLYVWVYLPTTRLGAPGGQAKASWWQQGPGHGRGSRASRSHKLVVKPAAGYEMWDLGLVTFPFCTLSFPTH